MTVGIAREHKKSVILDPSPLAFALRYLAMQMFWFIIRFDEFEVSNKKLLIFEV
jgi:hypothetical protein